MKTFKNIFSKLILVVLWSFLLTAVGTAAHAGGAISGTVDVTGQPVAIMIYSADSGNCSWDFVSGTQS